MPSGLTSFPIGKERGDAFVAEPEEGRARGSVVVVHEVWGFTPFVEDACLMLSRRGFVAAAPLLYWRKKDLFTPERLREGLRIVWDLTLKERYERKKLDRVLRKAGAADETSEMLRTLYDMAFRVRILKDLTALASGLERARPPLPLSAVGFSMGGRLALELAGASSRLASCVAFSADPVLGAALRRIRCPLLLLYGQEDTFMLGGLPAFLSAVPKSGVRAAVKTFGSAGHEFFDHTRSEGYNPAAAEEAWAAAFRLLETAATRPAPAPVRRQAETERPRPAP